MENENQKEIMKTLIVIKEIVWFILGGICVITILLGGILSILTI